MNYRNNQSMNLVQYQMKSPIGPIFLVASQNGLQGLLWVKHDFAKLVNTLTGKSPEILILGKAESQIQEYFAGTRKKFEIELDLQGTEFQKKVWTALQKIPYGSTCSYRDIAKKIRNDKAFRAVGTANGRNPISIIVPCHRVIAADGTLGGYAGGLPVKTQLLRLESN
jgi:methylated-DNA-[protein]-cysteine S-methyltransferase